VSTSQLSPAHPGGREPLRLWAGVVIPPLVWLIDLLLLYALQRYVCGTGNAWPFHLTTGVTLLVALWAGSVAWGVLSRTDLHERRRRFIGWGALALSGSFCLLILAQYLPVVMLEACV
jgi:hypothetical protein